MKQSSSFFQFNWTLVSQVVLDAKKRQELGKVPYTYYYYKSGLLIGSYFCEDEEGEFILFFNLDYPDPSLILEFIAEHSRILKEEVSVYPLTTRGIEIYERGTTKNYSMIEL